MRTIIHYRRDGQTVTLAVPRDPFVMVDHVRAYFHPDIVPDVREPAFLEAFKINRRKNG